MLRDSLGRGGRAISGYGPVADASTESRFRSTSFGALLVAAACLVPLTGVGALSATSLIREGVVFAIVFGAIGIAVASGRWRGRKDSARR